MCSATARHSAAFLRHSCTEIMGGANLNRTFYATPGTSLSNVLFVFRSLLMHFSTPNDFEGVGISAFPEFVLMPPADPFWKGQTLGGPCYWRPLPPFDSRSPVRAEALSFFKARKRTLLA